MKKFVALLLSLTVVFVLFTACSGGSQPASTDTSGTSSQITGESDSFAEMTDEELFSSLIGSFYQVSEQTAVVADYSMTSSVSGISSEIRGSMKLKGADFAMDMTASEEGVSTRVDYVYCDGTMYIASDSSGLEGGGAKMVIDPSAAQDFLDSSGVFEGQNFSVDDYASHEILREADGSFRVSVTVKESALQDLINASGVITAVMQVTFGPMTMILEFNAEGVPVSYGMDYTFQMTIDGETYDAAFSLDVVYTSFDASSIVIAPPEGHENFEVLEYSPES